MKSLKKALSVVLAIVMVFAFTSCGGTDNGQAEYTFTFACEDSSTAASAEVWNAYIERVSEMSDGRIKIEPYYGGVLGASSEQLNMAEQGSVDLTHVGFGHYAGRFPMSEVFTVPGLKYESSWQVGKALEWLYENSEYGYIADEIKDVKVLGFRSNNRNPLSHVGEPWETADDIKGTLINTSNGPTNDFLQALGMTQVAVAFPDRYEGIQKGLIEACNSDYLALESFSMYDVIDSVCDFSCACQAGYLVMSLDAWNSLPKDLQQVMEEAANTMVDDFYRVFKSVENNAYALAEEKNVIIYQPNAEVQKALDEAMAVGSQSWVDERTAEGYDAAGFLEEVQAALNMFEGQSPEV